MVLTDKQLMRQVFIMALIIGTLFWHSKITPVGECSFFVSTFEDNSMKELPPRMLYPSFRVHHAILCSHTLSIMYVPIKLTGPDQLGTLSYRLLRRFAQFFRCLILLHNVPGHGVDAPDGHHTTEQRVGTSIEKYLYHSMWFLRQSVTKFIACAYPWHYSIF